MAVKWRRGVGILRVRSPPSDEAAGRCPQQRVGVRDAHANIENETEFDEEHGRYLMMSQGWMGPKRVHGCLVHDEIRGDKIWIQ